MIKIVQQNVQQIQSNLLEAIKKTSGDLKFEEAVPFSKGFCAISNTAISEVYSHDSIGKKAKNFVNLMDFQHPDIQLRINDINKNLEIIHKGVKYFNLTKNSGFLEFFDRKYISKNLNSKFIKLISHPEWNCRWYSSSEKRNSFRKSVPSKRIGISKKFLTKNKSLFNKEVFVQDYIRFGDSQKLELEKYEARKNVFSNFNLICLMNAVDKNLIALNSLKEENYYGFQRMSVTSATIIACQLLGCKLDSDFNLLIDPSCLAGFESKCKFQHIIQPVLHPVHNLTPSSEMKELLSLLDNFPDANNKCIFDNYYVVTPCVRSEIYDDYQAKYDFDDKLIKEKRIFPLLLGQKEGKCYFISFWN